MIPFFKAFFSLLQVIVFAVGIVPVDHTVQYGGTPYTPPQVQTAMTLAHDGQADAVIVIGDDADDCIRTAADELRTYLEKSSGASFACVEASAYKAGEKAILLGDSEPMRLKTPAQGRVHICSLRPPNVQATKACGTASAMKPPPSTSEV